MRLCHSNIADMLSDCYSSGGTVGLLALNALFILMKEYNLYVSSLCHSTCLLTLIVTYLTGTIHSFTPVCTHSSTGMSCTSNIVHGSSVLPSFSSALRMSRLSLDNTRRINILMYASHLPVALLASFVKRLARLSLSAPPAAIVMIIPLTYNILKRHPALMVMIHRVEDSYEAFEGMFFYTFITIASDVSRLYVDPFNPAEPNPTLTNALESSLWELHTHHEHYHSAVSTLARIFSEAFTKPNYSLEDFLDHTYSTVRSSHSVMFLYWLLNYVALSCTRPRRDEELRRSPLLPWTHLPRSGSRRHGLLQRPKETKAT